MAVSVELVPFLAQLRDLYSQPRGFARFKDYLDILRTQTGEMELPISNVNPMAKPHVLERVEQLIALGAEEIALEAAREGAARLSDVDDALRLIVIVADDALGGWTNRAFAEFAHRHESKHQVQRGWVVVMLWSSEEPAAELIRAETLASLYRTIDERRNGKVRTLREILEREGRTLALRRRCIVRTTTRPIVRRSSHISIRTPRRLSSPRSTATRSPSRSAIRRSARHKSERGPLARSPLL